MKNLRSIDVTWIVKFILRRWDIGFRLDLAYLHANRVAIVQEPDIETGELLFAIVKKGRTQ